MANGWGGLLTVVSAVEVSDSLDAECEKYPRLRDGWEALEWQLCRSATLIGLPFKDDDSLRLYVQAGDALARIPAIWIIYRVGTDQVEILKVRFAAPEESDEAES